MQEIKVHREKLYKEVWEEPMSKLAVRYNVSDVALAKVCRKLQVPIPQRGYWARIQYGQHIARPKLPRLPDGAQEEATISPVLPRSRAIPDAVVRLVFRIHAYWAQGYRKSWADGARRLLEEQLNDIMPALVELSEAIRKDRLECERRNAEIDEEFRQRDLERARRQQMDSDLQNWRTALELRSLIAQVLSQASDEQKNAPGVARWIKWANWVASGNDPLNKGVASFVERYKF